MKRLAPLAVRAFERRLVAGALCVALAGCHKPAPNPGPLLFVSNIMDATVAVIEPSTGKVRMTKVGALPHNFARSPDGKTVLVGNTGSESVSMFNAATGDFIHNQLVAPIPKNEYHDKLPPAQFEGKTSCSDCHGLKPVGDLVSQVTYAPDGTWWVISFNPGAIYHYDPVTHKKLGELKMDHDKPFRTQPSNIQFTPDGKQMIVLHRRRGGAGFRGPGQHGEFGMSSFDHDAPPGNLASLMTFHSVDGEKQLGEVVMPASLPFKISFSKDGHLAYAAIRSTNKVAEVDVEQHALKRMLVVGEGPTNAVVSGDGNWLFVPSFYDDPPGVIKLELATGKIRAILPAQVAPTTVGLDPDTNKLYVCINGINRVLEEDTEGKGKILRWFPTGPYPLDLMVIPGSERAKLM